MFLLCGPLLKLSLSLFLRIELSWLIDSAILIAIILCRLILYYLFYLIFLHYSLLVLFIEGVFI